MGDKSITKCDQKAMLGYWFMLTGIITDLNEAYEKADSLLAKFDEAYEGEAKEEADIFLTNISPSLKKIKVYARRWLNYYRIARKKPLEDILRNYSRKRPIKRKTDNRGFYDLSITH